MPRVSAWGVGVVTLEGAVLGAAEPEMQSNTEPDTTAPRPGTEKIGGACGGLDRRPLGYAPHASLGEDVRVFSSAVGAMFGKRRSGRRFAPPKSWASWRGAGSSRWS